MRRINFSDVGVVVNSMEELEEIYLTFTALDIPLEDVFKERCIDAQERKLVGYFIQSTRGDLETTLEEGELYVSIIKYPIRYSMDKLDYAVACQLIKANQTDELVAHLNKYCKECK